MGYAGKEAKLEFDQETDTEWIVGRVKMGFC